MDNQDLLIKDGLEINRPLVRLSLICIFLKITLLVFTSCDEPFQPLAENDSTPLSIYGYLDASADTQWVRVSPIRDSFDMSAEKPEMLVTLEHLESGEKFEMNDSLFQFRQGLNVLNVWSAERLEPTQTYQLEATRPGSVTSRVTVTLPENFPDPVMMESRDGCIGILHINEVYNLADIQSNWEVQFIYLTNGLITFEEKRFFTFTLRENVIRQGEGSYTLSLNTNDELGEILDQTLVPPDVIQVVNREIFVANGGPEWSDQFRTIDDIIYMLPESFSNVENGLGYLVGIVSKTIPWMSCFQE